MAMWAIFAAPLLMSVDLRTIKPDYKAILQNRQIIAVNQDRLGIQGRRIYKVWNVSRNFAFVCQQNLLFSVATCTHFEIRPWMSQSWILFRIFCTLWKNQKFTLTEKIFRQINYLVISLVKALLSRNTVWKLREISLNLQFSVKLFLGKVSNYSLQ